MGDEGLEAAVAAAMDSTGVGYELVACDPALADTAEFCEHYGYPLDHSGNCIVVASRSEPREFVACVVLATTRLDVNRTVRKRMGVRKASFASAEDTRALTGMDIGGVTAVALPPGLHLWVDARVMDLDYVILGGGSRSQKVKTSPEVFRHTPDTEVVDGLASEPPDRS